MWYVVLSGMVLLVSSAWLFKKESGLDVIVLECFLAIALLLVGAFVIPATTGLMPKYSIGSRDGYITKLSTKGIIWKTNEGEMQLGVGEMASLQEPFKFSVLDKNVLYSITKSRGTSVRLYYNEWLIAPWSIGSSDYEIVSVDELN